MKQKYLTFLANLLTVFVILALCAMVAHCQDNPLGFVNKNGVTFVAPEYPFLNLQAQSLNNVRYCNQFPGVNAGQQINNCMADLPATGGVADARGISGAQTITANIFAGITKPILLLLGEATFTDSSCWTIPNDGSSPPKQSAIHIVGVGIDAASITSGKTPVTGTIINNSCNSGPAKIDTRGAGVIEIEGVTFMDTSGDSLPFFQTTNTIPKLHDNQFYGSQNGTSCNQDVIILGSSTTNIDGSATAAFQGYGGYVVHNFFNHIRRAVFGQTFANDVFVTQNTVWVQSGSNLAGGAAIEFNAGAGASNAGNVVRDNLLEVTNYPYGVKFSLNGFNNTITGNSCFDPSSTHLACIRFESTSSFNLVEDGYRNDTYAGYSEDVSSSNTNIFITSHQSQASVFPQISLFSSTGATTLRQQTSSVNAPMYNAKITTTNDEFWWGINTAGEPTYGLFLYPAGSIPSLRNLAQFRSYDGTQSSFFLNASATGYFECAADCRVRAAGASTLWLGTNTSSSDILLNDAGSKFNNTIDNSGTALKHIRSTTACTTAASIGATCTTSAISWNGTAFANTGYTLQCQFSGSVTNLPQVLTTTKSTGSFTVTIVAMTASAATYSEIDCSAFEG